ncbi:MAG: metallo-dependent phosphatase [Hyphomicrobiales bacterium]|nr:MAG: metallo-dependent phosphatase [Hyphomicrobiales bacterium]
MPVAALRLLVLSDLHLDHQPLEVVVDGRRIDESADVVVLAGDIDEGLKGLRWARQAFPDKPIVYVAGNHEFYGKEWSRHIADMRGLAGVLGIHFLERDAIEFEGIRFLGCTLWTDFQINGEDMAQACMQEAQHRLNDYRQIRFSRSSSNADLYWVRSKTIVPVLTLQRHRQSVEWLETQLAKGDPHRTVVVTHHAPHQLSVAPGYVGDPLTPSFVSDLDRLMGRSVLWIHGHVHDSFDYVVRGTRVVCNPRGYSIGYPPQAENDRFAVTLQASVPVQPEEPVTPDLPPTTQ